MAQEHGQVPVHQALVVGEGLGDFHVFLRQPVADAAGAGVQGHPDAVVVPGAQLDEVVAATERADLVQN